MLTTVVVVKAVAGCERFSVVFNNIDRVLEGPLTA